MDIAAKRAGIRTVCYVEYDAYAQGVLMSRMRDGGLDKAPIWSDVRTFDGSPWRGKVDCVFGGFPCQDVSQANIEGGGVRSGEKSGLWRDFARIVGEVRPGYVLVENVSNLLVRGIDVVLGDLASLGYDAGWDTARACEAGAPHSRERVFILAHAQGIPRHEAYTSDVPCRVREAEGQGSRFSDIRNRWREMARPDWVLPSSWVIRDIDGLANRAHRTRCTGNGVVADAARPFFEEIVRMAQGKLFLGGEYAVSES